MSVFRKIKSALGFAPSEEDEDERTDELLSPDNTEGSPDVAVAEAIDPTQSRNVADNVTAAIGDTLPGRIFDEAIRLFNEWQPEFVSRCLDTEAQRHYLYEAMDRQVRKALEDAVVAAENRVRAEVENERRHACDELAELRKQNERLDEKRQEMKNAQLSAQRQKRALSERIHDLESQVAQLEAEKEQYQLENRSMLNKLRLASVDGANHVAAALPEENSVAQPPACEMMAVEEHHTLMASLRAEIERLTEEMAGQSELAEKRSEEINALNSQLDTLKARHEADLKSLREECSLLRESESAAKNELTKTSGRIKELEESRNRRDLMVAEAKAATNKMRKQCEQQQQDYDSELTDMRQECQRLQQIIDTDRSDSVEREQALKEEIAGLIARLKESDERFEAAKTAIADAVEPGKNVVAAKSKKRRGRPRKVAVAEVISPAPDDKPDESDESTETNDRRKMDEMDEIDALPRPELKAAETLPRYDSIGDIRPYAPTRDIPPEATVASKRKVKPVISAIDELLDGSDWMTPLPEPVPRKSAKDSQTEDDFGYKAPPRRQHIDNDAQMSLW